ncbi:acyl-CoA synthetase (AMP-forming)/AMP-acid ligase II [Jatrophihabitans sp. GAS493]|uniref:class I adenylate-forming enzyme family protein n=1 Tax=Jatrophihabitans sp. GAS493 TaxID=1907575 RepID=UPI000BB8F9A0|nr:long-chain-fatty-acid--CoA ligase [Jatrophihabitans sp. GAS493]SOD71802.1 acyl-CoA synthetase (AMP-forming)/AMP-acid ligase II [Jatrophihabitans sp. GAS493]
MLFSDVLRLNAHRTPDKNALLMLDGSGSRSFAQLYARSNRLANALLGVANQGDRVAMLADNCPEYVEAYYGVPSAGMALTMLNYRLHPKEWVWILNNSGAQVLIVQAKYLETIADHLVELDSVKKLIVIGEAAAGATSYEDFVGLAAATPPNIRVAEDDIAWLLYTSGTTGFPKGAQLSHRNLCTAMLESVLAYEPTADSSFLNAMPLCHVAGYLTPVHQFYGGSVLMMSNWEPELWMRLVDEHQVTSGGFAPTMMSMLLDHPKVNDYKLDSLQWMGYGASKIPAEVLRRAIERFGPVVYAGMGMTELGGNILTLDKAAHIRAAAGEEHLLDAVGKPMALADVRVFDDNDVECADGQVGEIVVRGDQVTTGYFGNPDATAAANRNGWFHTGDLARRDAEGFLYIVDRIKDMIISGGENVYSSEVENAIYAHPAVAEAAVVGLADERWGERVAAVVVLRPGQQANAEEIITTCKARLASYKQPREVIFVDAIPKNVSGKVLKRELRERYSAKG